MSAEIILPACHHFNAEPATQAPKTSSAFQPCATVKRLTSPQPGESPVPLQKTQSAFMRVYKRNSSLVCRAVAHYGGGSLACQAVASAIAGHFRSLLNSSFCLLTFSGQRNAMRSLRSRSICFSRLLSILTCHAVVSTKEELSTNDSQLL